MVMTLADLRLEIREELGEADSEPDPMFSNAYLNKWINRYAAMIAKLTNCIEGYTTFTTTSGVKIYNMPSNFFKPSLVKRDDKFEITPIDIHKLKTMNISMSGVPNYYLILDNSIYFYDTPNTTYTINFWGYKYPAYMNNDTDVLDFEDEELIEALIMLVIARAKKKEEEYGVANDYLSKVPGSVSDYLTRTNSNQEQNKATVIDVMGYLGGGF